MQKCVHYIDEHAYTIQAYILFVNESYIANVFFWVTKP
jgi:hypothetical protein